MGNSSIDSDQKLTFLANTVHEIRTPVQTITGTLELLSDTKLNNEQQEYVRQIQFSTNVLLALVNDILDFTKIKSQEFTLESIPYDVATVTERVVDFVSVEAFSKGLELVTDVDYTLPQLVMGDPTRVQQILLNIIKNAVKFTKTGYVHLELSRADDDTMLFEITDTGIGIPEDKRKMLFTDFYQADASISRRYGGTGLGLAICKGLVTAMHGQIGVKSNPCGGSIFWFTLPLAASPNPPAENNIVHIPRDTRILVVDDNMLAMKSMERKLESLGFTDIQHADNAEDGKLVMKYAAKLGRPVNIVFVDMGMPKVDGWHFAWEIKEDPEINDSKLYLLVPEGQMGAEAKMKLINLFNGYLYKPVKRQFLLSLLQESYDTPLDLETVDSGKNDEKPAAENRDEDDSEVARGLCILVAEDHPLNRKLLATFLKAYGAAVFEAEDGQEAVDCISKNPGIDIIFMDIQMPVMNGTDAAKQIRLHNYSGIIIACTANNDENDFEQYRKIGMNDILVKPFKRTGVRAVLEKWKTVIELPGAKEIAILDSRTASINDSWDQKDFEDTVSGNTVLGCQLIDDYRSQTAALVYHAEQAVRCRDFEELRRIGHTLRGSSAAISANALAKYGALINGQARQSDIENIKKSLTAFKDEFVFFELSSDKWKKEKNEHAKDSEN
ncbi:MAG TPA: hybrid sensor histidine kinase/response regulator [Treponema sp.]|nr:hybrid sensor histidine kinase/response regulator [Treponema sp.]